MAIKIVTDSTCDLPSELCSDLDITVVPLTVHFGKEGFKDGIELGPEEFYDRLISADELPKTSQPSVGTFNEYYKNVAKETNEIVSIHISSKLSQTCNTAKLSAKEMHGPCNIEVIDSMQTSLGLGLVVIAAARAAKDGATISEVEEVARKAARGTKTLCLLDTLEYLAKGGRIGKVQFYLGRSLKPLSVFKVIPIIEILDGEAHPFDRVRTRRKGIERLVNELKQAANISLAGVVYSTNPKEADELVQEIKPLIGNDKLFASRFGPVLGTYVGPGAIGVTLTHY